MSLTVDYREQALRDELRSVQHAVAALPVGDVVCHYSDGGAWVLERKTSTDLSRSIAGGHWGDQLQRLHATGLQIFVVVEGDLRDQTLPYASLLGACINAELRHGCSLFRSCDVQETASVIQQLAAKCDRAPPGLPSGLRPPALENHSKRKREADKQNVFTKMLMCVPSVSERVAGKLFEHFGGSIPALQRAPVDIKNFPTVRLDDRSCLGQARLKAIAAYLVDEPAGDAR